MYSQCAAPVWLVCALTPCFVLLVSCAMLRCVQLEKTAASLAQLQSEHAEVTHVLIDAKVEIAEKKGE